MRSFIFFVVVALGFQSQIALGADEQPPKDWIKADFGGFVLYLPPDMKQQEVRGIDSNVRRYASGSITIDSDYGWYSDPLDSGYPKPFKTITVDGKPARIVAYDGAGKFPFLVAIHFPDTGRPSMKLTLGGACKDKAGAETLQRIYGTIHFK